MTKPLTVRQLKNRLEKLIDDGHGSAPVFTAFNPALPVWDKRSMRYVGPSEWDGRTYAWGEEDGIGSVAL